MPILKGLTVLLCLLLGACAGGGSTSGPITYLRAAVELDGLPVLQILQQYGPLQSDNGDALLRGVDAGTVKPYKGDIGHVLWYFRGDIGMPPTLPWVDAQGVTRHTPVVRSDPDKAPWLVYAKVPHWARLQVPTALLLKGDVAVMTYDFETVHDVHQTSGSFKNVPSTIVSSAVHLKELVVDKGYATAIFVFVIPIDGYRQMPQPWHRRQP